ncbi:hypothetical protein NPIL_371441, partial [Nephila pilipes]
MGLVSFTSSITEVYLIAQEKEDLLRKLLDIRFDTEKEASRGTEESDVNSKGKG